MLTVNEYFDGNVKSIGFQAETLPATVGVMAPGEYEFNTNEHECITVVSGALTVLLPNHSEWQIFSAGECFEVSANKAFHLLVSSDSAYLCTYGVPTATPA